MRRRAGARVPRVSFDELWSESARAGARSIPRRTAMFVTSRGITNEVYYVAQKVFRYPREQPRRQLCAPVPLAVDERLKSTVGVAATTCSYKDWFDADLIVFLGLEPGQRPAGHDEVPVTRRSVAERACSR
jgi:anaerobic selenocysteine-containing dehydrogenase